MSTDACYFVMADICLASSGDDIKLWDGNGFVFRRQFNPHSNNVSCITWAHDNTVSLFLKKK